MNNDIQKNNNHLEEQQTNNDQLVDKEELKVLQEKLEQCEKEKTEYLAGWQRARADLSNYKKEEAERFREFSKYATESLVLDLIPVLDSFDLGIAAMEKAGNMDKGIYMIKAQLEDVLKERGLSRIKIEIGQHFDPKISEAIAEVEYDGPSGIVLEEIEAGYKLYDKVIRPARVKVSKQKNL